MRYLLSVLDTQTGEATQTEMQAINEFNAELESAGFWVMAAGLQHPDKAFVVTHEEGEPIATPGPHVRTERYISGFWIIETDSAESALALAKRAAAACNRAVEVRSFL